MLALPEGDGQPHPLQNGEDPMSQPYVGERGEPITLTLYPGGMCGPEGSSSRESFFRRRRITLHALIQEDHLPGYVENKDDCIDLGKLLGELLYHHLSTEVRT
jgi:hypothetical protein